MSDGLRRIFGIDPGTTCSAIACVDEHGKPVLVSNQERERITPSVVLFDGDNVIAGNTAKESAKVEPDRVVGRVKQHMGDPHFVFEHDGQAYSPEDVGSSILRKVVSDAETALGGEPITNVVTTCPAYFGTDEREATANTGRLAGLNVRAALNEPTVAAIAYGLEQADDQTVLAYDPGGGTFDITMIEIKDRLIRVIRTGGDHRLGGALWDEAIVMYLADQFHQKTGLDADPMDDPEVLNGLFLQAERGKRTLTRRDKAPFRATHAGQQARVELDRTMFEEITKHLLDRTIELTRDMLNDAKGKGTERFDKIILVGGTTRTPRVRNRLVNDFGKEPEVYDPDEAAARRAALFGLKEALRDRVHEILAPEHVGGDDDHVEINSAAVGDAEISRRSTGSNRPRGSPSLGPCANWSVCRSSRCSQKASESWPGTKRARMSSSSSWHATARCRWSKPPTSAPTNPTRRGSKSRSWLTSATARTRSTAKASVPRRSTSPVPCRRAVQCA